LRRFLPLEHVTCFDNGGWIDCDIAFVDVPDNAFFVDQEGGAISKTLLLVEDPVILYYCAFEIAEEREGNSKLFGEFAVGENAVYTHSENLSFGGFEFGDISLIRLQLLRSTTCESEHINRQYDIFLTFEIAQLVSLSVGSTK
jgi:hypothetical protein